MKNKSLTFNDRERRLITNGVCNKKDKLVHLEKELKLDRQIHVKHSNKAKLKCLT